MEPELLVRVVHSLPGRVRLRLSIQPADPQAMEATVKEHPGIFEVSFNPHTRSVLLRFDPDETSQEELIIRVAVFLSLENDLRPVKVYSDPDAPEISNSAFLSGFLLVTALAGRLVPQLTPARPALDWSAGVGTAYSIVDHAYGELKERDSFDPEALSVIYLLTSFAQGRFLPAALFSWIATFGRHLMKFSARNVEVCPVQVADTASSGPEYEVAINPVKRVPGKAAVLRVLPALLIHAAMGSDAGSMQGTLLQEIKKISQDHGEVLEGFGKLKDGMPIRIRSGRA